MAKIKNYNDSTRQIIWDDVDKDLIKHKYTFPCMDCPAGSKDDPRYFSPTKHGNLWCRNETGCGKTVYYNSFKKVWDDELQMDVPDVEFKFVKKRWRENEDLRELITLRVDEFKEQREQRLAKQREESKKRNKKFKKVKSFDIIKIGNKIYREVK